MKSSTRRLVPVFPTTWLLPDGHAAVGPEDQLGGLDRGGLQRTGQSKPVQHLRAVRQQVDPEAEVRAYLLVHLVHRHIDPRLVKLQRAGQAADATTRDHHLQRTFLPFLLLLLLRTTARQAAAEQNDRPSAHREGAAQQRASGVHGG